MECRFYTKSVLLWMYQNIPKNIPNVVFIQFQFSRSVVSDSLWPHGLKHARPLCPSSTPWVYPNTHPSSRWCHPAISSSVVPFSSCTQSHPASGSFQMSQLFASGGQSIRVSASASVLPMNTQDWSPLGWTDWTSLQSSISYDVLCIEVKYTGWQYIALTYSFSYLQPVCCSMSISNCCFLTCK